MGLVIPALVIVGIAALVMAKGTPMGPTTKIHAKPGEIWRIEGVLNPTPGPAEIVRIMNAMAAVGAPVREQGQLADGLHLVWDQQIPKVGAVLEFPKRITMAGASLVMKGAKRVG